VRGDPGPQLPGLLAVGGGPGIEQVRPPAEPHAQHAGEVTLRVGRQRHAPVAPREVLAAQRLEEAELAHGVTLAPAGRDEKPVEPGHALLGGVHVHPPTVLLHAREGQPRALAHRALQRRLVRAQVEHHRHPRRVPDRRLVGDVDEPGPHESGVDVPVPGRHTGAAPEEHGARPLRHLRRGLRDAVPGALARGPQHRAPGCVQHAPRRAERSRHGGERSHRRASVVHGIPQRRPLDVAPQLAPLEALAKIGIAQPQHELVPVRITRHRDGADAGGARDHIDGGHGERNGESSLGHDETLRMLPSPSNVCTVDPGGAGAGVPRHVARRLALACAL
jgi:hypothetical protein